MQDDVVVVVEFYLKLQHKQAMAPSFTHASDMTHLIIIIVMGRGGEKITSERSHRR